MGEKRIPLRMCCVCRRYFPKNELFRVVKTPEGEIFLDDEKGKTNGRGAYVCKSEQCVSKCTKTKILNRQLGETDEDVYARMKEKI